MTDGMRKSGLIAETLAKETLVSRRRAGKTLAGTMVAGTMVTGLAIAGLALADLAHAGSALAAPQGGPAVGSALPKPVQTYLDRLAGCSHWGGEEPYDAARARAIEAAIRKLGCDALAADETRLRRLYARVPAIIDALDKARALDD